MSVLRFDPFRDFDRLVAEQMAGLRGAPRSVPMDAYRRGDQFLFLVHLLLVGDSLDTDRLEADYDQGVLTVRIPVAEAAKPRRVEITKSGGGQRAIVEGQAARTS